MNAYESIIRYSSDKQKIWETACLRNRLSSWRFYDHFRTDSLAPARQTQIGTRTVSLSADGGDIAAAIATIYEIGDGEALDAAIDHAFQGAKLEIRDEAGGFNLHMHQKGILRPLSVAELSDGTLRFILLAAALLAPRPAPLLVFNEPEASLYGELIPALAALISRASQDSQIVVVSHNRSLVSSLICSDAELIELYKDTGETFATVSEPASWKWPSR